MLNMLVQIGAGSILSLAIALPPVSSYVLLDVVVSAPMPSMGLEMRN